MVICLFPTLPRPVGDLHCTVSYNILRQKPGTDHGLDQLRSNRAFRSDTGSRQGNRFPKARGSNTLRFRLFPRRHTEQPCSTRRNQRRVDMGSRGSWEWRAPRPSREGIPKGPGAGDDHPLGILQYGLGDDLEAILWRLVVGKACLLDLRRGLQDLRDGFDLVG